VLDDLESGIGARGFSDGFQEGLGPLTAVDYLEIIPCLKATVQPYAYERAAKPLSAGNGVGRVHLYVVENVNSSVSGNSSKRIPPDGSELTVRVVLALLTGRAPKLISDRLEALQPLFAKPAQDAIRHSLPTGL